MELKTTLNRVFAGIGAALHDAGYPEQGEHVLSWVGHQDVTGRPHEDAATAMGHAKSILTDEAFGGMMCPEMARALAAWSDTWGMVPQMVEAMCERCGERS